MGAECVVTLQSTTGTLKIVIRSQQLSYSLFHGLRSLAQLTTV